MRTCLCVRVEGRIKVGQVGFIEMKITQVVEQPRCSATSFAPYTYVDTHINHKVP